MPTITREVREQLITYDEGYQKLIEEHSKYETQLEQLSKSDYLNLEDLELQVKLKKLKLRVKDEMEKYVADRTGIAPPH
jgi:uncharacterized protein YdcH (DUF465 family)